MIRPRQWRDLAKEFRATLSKAGLHTAFQGQDLSSPRAESASHQPTRQLLSRTNPADSELHKSGVSLRSVPKCMQHYTLRVLKVPAGRDCIGLLLPLSPELRRIAYSEGR